MSTTVNLFAFTGLLAVAFWLSWWFKAIIIALVSGIAWLVHRSLVNKVKHQKSDLERQLLEKNELLGYAVRNEQKAREEADKANQYRSDLLTKISHEVRTPMNAVMGMAALLNETTLNEEQREYANTIVSSGESLLKMVNDILMNDILDFSKEDSNKQLEPKPFDLHTAIEEVLDVFAAKAADRAGLDLVYYMADDVPQQIVCDNLRLRQVIMNMVENSVKFTPWGEVAVGVHVMEYGENNSLRLQFEIRDTGIGMSKEKLAQLKKELVNINASPGNNGLGLVICKKLVHLMGGTIDVKSHENEGTTFTFDIWTNSGVQSPRTAIKTDMAGLEGKKVLVADDNTTVGNLVKRQLDQWQLDGLTVESGAEALDVLKVTPNFDLVLVDMQMPEMDGIDLAQAIKNMYPEMPVILMNKMGDESFRKHPELFCSVINKPLRRHILSEQVMGALRHKGKGIARVEKRKLDTGFAKQYPLNILIAEDNEVNQVLVTKVLKKLGYEATMTNNGKEVLEEVSHNNYDLILMDVQMPEMDGLEATRMIRLCLSVQPIIIAMTANSLQGDRDQCLQAGMDDYISKPVKLDELVNILEKWAIQVKETH